MGKAKGLRRQTASGLVDRGIPSERQFVPKSLPILCRLEPLGFSYTDKAWNLQPRAALVEPKTQRNKTTLSGVDNTLVPRQAVFKEREDGSPVIPMNNLHKRHGSPSEISPKYHLYETAHPQRCPSRKTSAERSQRGFFLCTESLLLGNRVGVMCSTNSTKA